MHILVEDLHTLQDISTEYISGRFTHFTRHKY